MFSYDAVGRIVNNSQCTPINCASGNHPFSYSYNLAGDMTQRTLYYGVVLQPTINLGGLSSQMTESFSDSNHPGTLISAAHYNAFGELVSANLGNGIAQSRTFNTRGWLQSLTDGTLYNVNTPSTPISYAPDGNLLAANDKINGSWSYGYDDFNRLKTANGSAAGNYSYDYDRFGNRWHQNGTAGWSQSFDTNNHIQGAPWSYEAAGNMINDTFHSYAYDAENRLIRVDGGTTATYIYDAEGRRVRSTRNGTTVDYMYGLGGEVAEMNSGGSLNRAEIYFAGAHLATFTNPMMYFNHSDWLGTERVRSSVSGAQVETCTGLPFGDAAGCSGTDASPLHFTGDEHDSESNLEHTQFRQLSSAQGRWLSPDPYKGSMDLTNPQSLNRYSYVLNSPCALYDRLGTSPCSFNINIQTQFTGSQLQEIEASLSAPFANAGVGVQFTAPGTADATVNIIDSIPLSRPGGDFDPEVIGQNVNFGNGVTGLYVNTDNLQQAAFLRGVAGRGPQFFQALGLSNAHEIGHYFLQQPNHSLQGLLRSGQTSTAISDMLNASLNSASVNFTPEQASQVRNLCNSLHPPGPQSGPFGAGGGGRHGPLMDVPADPGGSIGGGIGSVPGSPAADPCPNGDCGGNSPGPILVPRGAQ